MLFKGRKIITKEDFYGFTAKPGFIVGYVGIEDEERDLGLWHEEYPFAMSGWNVAGMYCVYLYIKSEWEQIWCNPDDHASLKQMLADMLTEELEAANAEFENLDESAELIDLNEEIFEWDEDFDPIIEDIVI